MATNIINQNLQNLQDPDTDMNQMIPEGGINFNDVKNYASIPATYAAGLYGNYINKNVGENMARSFRTDEMNERLSQQVGDQLPEGVNSGSLTYTDFGLDPVREYLGGGEYKNTRDYNPPSLEKAISLNSADAANAHTLGNLNFTKDPSGNINYTGNRFDFPYSTTLNNDPMTIPLDELNVNAPQFSFTNYLQGKNDFNIGTPISSTTNFNDSYNYNDVDAMTADEQGQLPIDPLTPQQTMFGKAKDLASSGIGKAGKLGMDAFNMLKNNNPMGLISSGLGGLTNMLGGMFEDKQLYADTYDEFGNKYTADQLNSMNARGGYYTDPARASRRRQNSIYRMEKRKADGKTYGKNRLETLRAIEQKAQEARDKATADKVAAFQQQRANETGAGSWGTGDEANTFGENIGSGGWDSYT